ncbi:MAG: carboxylating nicotinate-nucleotide diphosphorylase [Firmicutes bacterium]|nr:carboxylating nicotinate-nucleotide diphosphorylase [Bacillota bacterium]
MEPLLKDTVSAALREDLFPMGDITSFLIPEDAVAAGTFVARQNGILAGMDAVKEVIRQVDPLLELEIILPDGAAVASNDALAVVRGKLRSIVTSERTALNFLSHLSGIASRTNLFVEKIKTVSSKTRILDTRKTVPGLRFLEKAAVRAGGGHNHRGNLSEAVMLKDTHLAFLEIKDAVAKARSIWPGRFIEVECETIEQVRQATLAGSDIVMFDNMPIELAKAAKEALMTLGSENYRLPLVEVSGCVDMGNIVDYAKLDVDFISLGTITNSAPALDIGLDILN